MLVRPAIPETAQGRHLVVARAASGLKGQSRIRTDRNIENVISPKVLRRNLEPTHREQLVIRVQGRWVTASATFVFEDPLSGLSDRIEAVRIRRWLQRIQIESESI